MILMLLDTISTSYTLHHVGMLPIIYLVDLFLINQKTFCTRDDNRTQILYIFVFGAKKLHPTFFQLKMDNGQWKII